MIRIFIQQNQLQNNFLILPEKEFHHLTRVQRVKKGEKIALVLAQKEVWEIRIEAIFDERIQFKLLKRSDIIADRIPRIILAQGLPKQDKFGEILKMNTELGVSGFWPLITERVISIVEGKKEQKAERWQAIIQSAAEQAELNFMPNLAPLMKLAEFLNNIKKEEFDLKIVLYEKEKEYFLKAILKDYPDPKKSLILVGPEGGFSEQEVINLKQNGFYSVNIGNSILRTEYAGFAAAAMIIYEYN